MCLHVNVKRSVKNKISLFSFLSPEWSYCRLRDLRKETTVGLIVGGLYSLTLSRRPTNSVKALKMQHL